MRQADFLVTAAGLIPLLSITLLIELRVLTVPYSLRRSLPEWLTDPTRQKLERSLRSLKIVGSLTLVFILVTVAGAEFVCLHYLEVGRDPAQLWRLLIWFALCELAFLIGSQLLIRIWLAAPR